MLDTGRDTPARSPRSRAHWRGRPRSPTFSRSPSRACTSGGTRGRVHVPTGWAAISDTGGRTWNPGSPRRGVEQIDVTTWVDHPPEGTRTSDGVADGLCPEEVREVPGIYR